MGPEVLKCSVKTQTHKGEKSSCNIERFQREVAAWKREKKDGVSLEKLYFNKANKRDFWKKRDVLLKT